MIKSLKFKFDLKENGIVKILVEWDLLERGINYNFKFYLSKIFNIMVELLW